MSGIWVPKFKILEPKKEIGMVSRVGGRFMMEAVRASDGRRRPVADFPNLITDQGLNYAGENRSWLGSMAVGFGTDTPTVGDTDLGNRIASTSAFDEEDEVRGARSTEPYYGFTIKRHRFGMGDAEGNLTEVGIGADGNGWDTLFSRALILDAMGQPAVFPVDDDEFLDVTYEFRNYPPLVDIEDTVNIGGVNYDFVLRAASVTNASFWAVFRDGEEMGLGGTHRAWETDVLGDITSDPGSGANNASGDSNAAYGTGNFYRDGTVTFGLTTSNFATGIGAVACGFGEPDGAWGRCQISFSPKIPKDNTKILTLQLRHSIARLDS